MIDKGRPLGSVNVRMRPGSKGRAVLGRSTGDPFSSQLGSWLSAHQAIVCLQPWAQIGRR